MRKFLFAVLIFTTALAFIGCGGAAGDNAKKVPVLSEKNVDAILDDVRLTEKEGHYEIHGVQKSEKDGQKFCSAFYDKSDRGSVTFTLGDKDAIVGVKILATDPSDFELGFKSGFLLTRILSSIGVTPDEGQKFAKEYGDYANAEVKKQNNPVTPTIDKEFKISSSQLKKTINVRVKADEKELSYTISAAN